MTAYPDNGAMTRVAAIAAAKEHGDAVAYYDPETGGYGWYTQRDFCTPGPGSWVNLLDVVYDSQETPDMNALMIDISDDVIVTTALIAARSQ